MTAIPPALWNACGYVLQFDFRITHIVGSVNTAADFFFRQNLKITEKIHHKIREGIHTTTFEVTTSSSEVTDGKQFFFTRTDNENDSEQKLLDEENNPDRMRING